MSDPSPHRKPGEDHPIGGFRSIRPDLSRLSLDKDHNSSVLNHIMYERGRLGLPKPRGCYDAPWHEPLDNLMDGPCEHALARIHHGIKPELLSPKMLFSGYRPKIEVWMDSTGVKGNVQVLWKPLGWDSNILGPRVWPGPEGKTSDWIFWAGNQHATFARPNNELLFVRKAEWLRHRSEKLDPRDLAMNRLTMVFLREVFLGIVKRLQHSYEVTYAGPRLMWCQPPQQNWVNHFLLPDEIRDRAVADHITPEDPSP